MATAAFHKGDTLTVRDGERTLLERRTTTEEQSVWYASPAAQGMDSAGETKLAPRSTSRYTQPGEALTVMRGRARFTPGWGNPMSGWTQVQDVQGTLWFVRTKELLNKCDQTSTAR